ncbi:MAG: MltA domain-containing protein [Pseudomonadota bacterium]
MKNILAALTLSLLLTACGDATKITPVTYGDLAGWNEDRVAAAYTVFIDSCRVNENRKNAYSSKSEGSVGVTAYWQRACALAQENPQPSDAQARRFFETYFAPYKVETESKPTGTMTGYYEPILRGSRTRQAPFLTPVHGVPKDLGQRKPYFSRAEIVNGALKGRAPVLLYVEDPIMLFFLHVQGSGKVRLPDGSLVGLQYAGQNGYAYTPIGRVLKERGEEVAGSMQGIRDWLRAHPREMDEVMDTNQSYVFFKLSPGDEMAKGALGIPLTPLRSIAVDDDRAAYGVPTYIDTTQSEYLTGKQIPLQRLFVSQDTGGALKGPHRADLFYGRGDVEEWQAGHQFAQGNVYWLLPLEQGVKLTLPTDGILQDNVPPLESPTLAQMPADGPAPMADATQGQ